MPRLLVVFALLLSIGLAMANTCRWAGVASQADEQDDSYQFCNETTGEVLVDELDQSVLTVPLGPFSYGTCEKFEPQLTDEQVQEEYDLAVRPYFKGDLVRDPSDPQNEALLLIDQFGDPGCTFSQRRVTLRFGKQADICKQAQATSQGVATEIYFNTMDDCQVFAAADQTTQDQIARDSWKGSSNTIEGFENTLFDPLPLLQQFAQTVNPNLRYSTENKVQEKSFTQQPNWQHDNSYCYGVGEFIEPPFHIPVIFKNPNNTNMHLFRNDIAIPGTDFRGDGFLCFESCHQTIVDIINSNPTEPFLWPLHFANSTCGRFYELFNAYNASNANVPSDYGLGAGNYALASLFLEIWQPRPCNVCQEIVPFGQPADENSISSILGRIGEAIATFTGSNSTVNMVAGARLQFCQPHKVLSATAYVDTSQTSGWPSPPSESVNFEQCLTETPASRQDNIVRSRVRGSATITTVVTEQNRGAVEYSFRLALQRLINPSNSDSLPALGDISATASLSRKSSEVDYEIRFVSSTSSNTNDVKTTLDNTDEEAFGDKLGTAFAEADLGSVSVNAFEAGDVEAVETPTSAGAGLVPSLLSLAAIAAIALAYAF